MGKFLENCRGGKNLKSGPD